MGLLAVASELELLLGALDRPLNPKVLLSNPVVTVHAAGSQPIPGTACCLMHNLEYTQVTGVVHKALAETTLLAKCETSIPVPDGGEDENGGVLRKDSGARLLFEVLCYQTRSGVKSKGHIAEGNKVDRILVGYMD